jgi:tight adherence protein B
MSPLLILIIFAVLMLVMVGTIMLVTAPSGELKTVQARLTSLASRNQVPGELPVEATQLLRKTNQASFGWMERTLETYKPIQRISRYVMQSGAKTTASVVMVQSLVCAAVGFGIVLVMFPWFVVEAAAALAAGSLPWVRIIFLRARRMKSFDNALAHGIDMMARALRAGHSVAGSIELIAQGCPEPAASEFAEVFRQQNFGMPLRDAFLQMLDRVPSQDLRVVVTAILVQRETGGNLVDILDRTVNVIRERQRIHGEIRTQTAQGRLTGWILTLLPVIMLGLINVSNPGYSKPLFTTPLGRELLYTGMGFIVLGAFWIRRIINKIEV